MENENNSCDTHENNKAVCKFDDGYYYCMYCGKEGYKDKSTEKELEDAA